MCGRVWARGSFLSGLGLSPNLARVFVRGPVAALHCVAFVAFLRGSPFFAWDRRHPGTGVTLTGSDVRLNLGLATCKTARDLLAGTWPGWPAPQIFFEPQPQRTTVYCWGVNVRRQ